ncbi:MAG: glycosyltransferase [Ignavibacteriales bacterium]|nr:MAG: glycosyltransferase [Ignavibacteriales bacterium]
MILSLIVIVVLAFLILNFFLLYGLKTLFTKSPVLIESEVSISIIIAVKNESKNLPALLISLGELDYPTKKFEVVFVDDSSDDGSYQIIQHSIQSYQNFRLIKAKNKIYPGKKGALEFGIASAKFPYIIITDGDCIVSKNWLKGFSNMFSLGFNFAFGICPINKGKNFVSLLSCFENLRTEILTFGIANLGLPYSTAARSLGFQKESFIKLGGYKNTVETISGDDDLLLREAVKNKLKIGILTEPGTFVFSNSESTLTEYFHQKKRHTSTSNHYLFRHQLILGLWHFTNLLSLGSVFLSFISIYFIIPFLIKLLMDIFIVKKYMKRFGVEFELHEIIFLQSCYEIFLVIHYLRATFSRKISWEKADDINAVN